MKKTCNIISIALVALISLPSTSQETKPSGILQIRGQVQDQAKKPLAEAVLKLYDCNDKFGSCEKVIRLTRSGPDGSFILNAHGVKPGAYSLEATLPPFYLPKAKEPVIVPDDGARRFDFVMLSDTRDEAGNLVGVSADDAKEIYAAARIEKNEQLGILCMQIVKQDYLKREKAEEARAQTGIREDQARMQAEQARRDAARRALDAGALSSGESVSIEGCLSGSAGSYTLTDQSGKAWTLAGNTSKLTEHVGHQVHIIGSSPYNSAASSSASSGSSDAGSSSGAGSIFSVKKVKMISGTCSMFK